jgi:Tol biopolymer transport system component
LTEVEHTKLGGWSPSGDRIGFASYSSERDSLDIFVVKATGGTLVNMTPDEYWEYAPSWTPNGRWIYYSSAREGKMQICRIPAEGGPSEQVTEDGGEVPKVVSDDEFYFWREDGIWRLNSTSLSTPSLSRDEFEETRILEKELGFFSWNVWRGQIVYLDEVEDRPVIEMFDPVTGQFDRLYTFEKGTIFGNGVTISPDGQWVVYGQREDESDSMYVDNFY